MRKVVKKWGNSLVIVFDKEDIESYKIKENDIIDIKKFDIIRRLKEMKNKNV